MPKPKGESECLADRDGAAHALSMSSARDHKNGLRSLDVRMRSVNADSACKNGSRPCKATGHVRSRSERSCLSHKSPPLRRVETAMLTRG